MDNNGLALIISGPSGVGKGTVIKAFLENNSDFSLSTSYTTRKPRKNEINGKDYFFVTKSEFLEKIKNKAFFEWAKVHGNYYGTDKDTIKAQLAQGQKIIFEIDVQGAMQLISNIKKIYILSIFLMAPNLYTLKQRLNDRGSESEKNMFIRLENAKKEIELSKHFDFSVVNDRIMDTINQITGIIQRRK